MSLVLWGSECGFSDCILAVPQREHFVCIHGHSRGGNISHTHDNRDDSYVCRDSCTLASVWLTTSPLPSSLQIPCPLPPSEVAGVVAAGVAAVGVGVAVVVAQERRGRPLRGWAHRRPALQVGRVAAGEEEGRRTVRAAAGGGLERRGREGDRLPCRPQTCDAKMTGCWY